MNVGQIFECSLGLAGGLLRHSRAFRLAALGVMALVVGKVFLVDMAGLTGLWRVLSFLGLGLTLIGLGRLYGRVAVRSPKLQGQNQDPA